jgi:hypothetical protein
MMLTMETKWRSNGRFLTTAFQDDYRILAVFSEGFGLVGQSVIVTAYFGVSGFPRCPMVSWFS